MTKPPNLKEIKSLYDLIAWGAFFIVDNYKQFIIVLLFATLLFSGFSFSWGPASCSKTPVKIGTEGGNQNGP